MIKVPHNVLKLSFLAHLAILSTTHSANASWLSEITGINLDVPNGSFVVKPPNLDAIVPMLQNLPKDVAQVALNPHAPQLATAIRYSRAEAIRRGVQPIPNSLRQQLASYFPPGIVDRVRWTTVSGGFTLDAFLANVLRQEGAITLDDVIVFSDGQLSNNRKLVNELTHVVQYANMGIDTFAFTYMYGFLEIERQARENADRIEQTLLANRSYSVQTHPGSLKGSLMSWSSINEAAKEVYDPASCIWISGTMMPATTAQRQLS